MAQSCRIICRLHFDNDGSGFRAALLWTCASELTPQWYIKRLGSWSEGKGSDEGLRYGSHEGGWNLGAWYELCHEKPVLESGLG